MNAQAGRVLVAALAAVVVLGAVGCGSSGANKAGGTQASPAAPVVLTLVTGDSSSAAPEFAAAVKRLSGGSMRIETRVQRVAEVNYERFTVEDVRAGKADLGLVGARVFDMMGATSLRALVAPFLVDSMTLQQRVLESPLVARMLAGVQRAGVVGIAVLPGRLRSPLGITRALLGPRDFDGATIGIRTGAVARSTLDSLGASAKDYVIGNLSGVDGAELDPATIISNGYDARAKALTANVVLWPNAQTIVANRGAIARLTPARRAILRRAGSESVAPELTRIEAEEGDALAAICDRHAALLATASPRELAALRRSVRPVYAELERDPVTRALIAEIEKLREAPPAARAQTLTCRRSDARSAAASRLNGLWRVTTTAAELRRAGAEPGEAQLQSGPATLELEEGRWIGREERTGRVWSGRYEVRGGLLRLTTNSCDPANICVRKAIEEFKWSVYGDRLSLVRLLRPPFFYPLVAKPFTRVR